MLPRKKPSGAQNRKRKAEEALKQENFKKTMSLDRYHDRTVPTSTHERFQQFKEFSSTWGFLFYIDKLPEREELIKHCSDLEIKYTSDEGPDIIGKTLCDELVSLATFFDKKKEVGPLDVLKFVKKMDLRDLYPNTWIALRILLTTPVTVASGERSFSKLKLIKTYLRSTMAQDRLTSLATLSIENEMAHNIEFSQLVKTFASAKARKICFD